MKEYSERAPFSGWLKSLLFLVIAFFALTWGFVLVEGFTHVAVMSMSIATVIIAVAFWAFSEMRFGVTDQDVYGTFGPYRYRVPFEDIKSVRVRPRKEMHWYYGWGFRKGMNRTCFISQMKDSVEVTRKSGHVVIMTSRDPRAFLQVLKRAAKL